MREDARWTVVPMRVSSSTHAKHSTHRPTHHTRHHHPHHHQHHQVHHVPHHEVHHVPHADHEARDETPASIPVSRRKCPIHERKEEEERMECSSSRGSSDWEYEYPDETDIIEEKVHISLKSGQSLGCSVVRGPTSYPGIFVQDVKCQSASAAAGLQVGDQILGMNGFSFFPGHYNFDDAIRKIKACTQMTLTVRKGVGLHLFHDPRTRGTIAEDTDTDNRRNNTSIHSDSDYDPEKDFDLTGICTTTDMMLKVRLEEQRLAEDRRLLAEQQVKLQQEMQRLAVERKELEALRLQAKSEDGGSSISSGDMMSILSSSSSPDPQSSPALGFLDELKQLAEKRSSADSGLLLDTLKKTPERKETPVKQITHPDDEKRKRHELLMQEFKSAHHKMFGKTTSSSGSQVTDSSLLPKDSLISDAGHEHEVTTANQTHGVNGVTSAVLFPPTGAQKESPVVSAVETQAERVMILKTWSPVNKKQLPPPPPPPPLPRPQPLVTITSYQTKTHSNSTTQAHVRLAKSSSRDNS